MTIVESVDKLNDLLSLRDKVVVYQPLRVVLEKLETGKPSGFSIRKSEDETFVFEVNFALTTGMGPGIVGRAKPMKTQEENTTIELTTKPQASVCFSIVLAPVFIIAMFFVEETIPLWIPAILLIMPLWFFFILRFQEKMLFDKMKSFLTET